MADANASQDFLKLLAVIGLGSNVALIVSAIKIIRNISRMELKVDTMWGVFMRKYGTRQSDNEDTSDG